MPQDVACLDFVNAVHSFDDAARWVVSAGVLKRPEKRKFKPNRRELVALVRLAEILREVFTHRRCDRFNKELKRALRQLRVDARGRWSIEAGVKTVRYRLLWDAATLLTSDRIAHLKRCASPTCTWLFIDESRRRNRRWCSMSDCGNKAKARRYYKRAKAARRSSSRKRPSARA